MQGIVASVSITVQPDEPVVVYCSPYLEKLDNVLSRYDRRSDLELQYRILFTDRDLEHLCKSLWITLAAKCHESAPMNYFPNSHLIIYIH